MKNYSLELRSIFDKPYFSANVADLSLLEKLQNGLKELEGVKNVNISEGKRRHLTIYGETFVDVKEVHKQIKDYLDAFNDANNILENSSKEQVKNRVDNFTPPVPQYTEIPKDCPTVFISHAWDDEEHKKWILKLAHDLEAVYGINVLCDFYNQGGIDLTSFMIHGISKANRVLIIGTPKYKEKSESLDNSGVSFEGMIMSSILFREKNVDAKFIPILKEGSFESSFNTMMGVRTGYDLSTVENYNANIKLLAQDVWNEPAIQRPKRAHKPNFNRVDREEKQESELPIWKKIVLQSAVQYMEENFSDENMTLNTVACVANVSANHFSAMFSQKMGQTFIEYLTGLRMNKAKELLRCTDKRSGEIALEVGYKDSHYFSFLFKKTQGCTPSEYRNQGAAK